LLAPFGVRFVVAREGDLPDAAAARFAEQLDLDRLTGTTGLVVFSNVSAWPPASIVQADDRLKAIVASSDPAKIAQLRPVPFAPMTPVTDGWDGPGAAGDLVVIGTEDDGGWRRVAGGVQAERAFGWAVSLPADSESVQVRHDGTAARTISLWLLAALWAGALWITRRPVGR
jgi:hypothetical protein